jgi:hypothetical protein
MRSLLAISCVLLLACAGCSEERQPAPKPESSAPITIPSKLWEQFSGENAFREVERQVAIGPRPSGSAAIEDARKHIAESLQASGWEVERQEFEHEPVPGQGKLKFVNVIGRYSKGGTHPAPRDTQRVIIGSHYDTKRMTGIRFVGANDGASSTGALIELARVLAGAPELAARIELVFFDGEEAVISFGPAETGPDGLVGSRHYAHQLRSAGRAAQFRFAIVWDMIGDKDLTVTLPSDTPKHLAGGIFTAAEALGVRKQFGYAPGSIIDDHTPLQIIARIPAMDIIDFDFLPWHTSGDTLDKVSAESLQTIGRTTLWMLTQELAK